MNRRSVSITTPLMGGVLLGGGSRRMGRPKQLISIDGETMAERVVSSLEPRVAEVYLLGSGEVPAPLGQLTRLDDAPNCRGPLAGILAALRHNSKACWIVAACDMPMIQPAAIWWLFGARRLGTSIVLPRIGDRVEPLLALYEPSALGLLEEAAATGQLALHRLASRSSVRCVEPPASLRESWFNANTPADLQSLEAS